MSGLSESWDTEEDPEENPDRSELDSLVSPFAAASSENPTADSAIDSVPTLLFTATNPPGTVSVTAMIDGRVLRVDLSSGVVEMTEHELSEEILLLSSLAQLQAGAAKHTLIAEFMTRLGRDRVAVAANLEYEIGLPSPESVRERREAAFAARSHVYGY